MCIMIAYEEDNSNIVTLEGWKRQYKSLHDGVVRRIRVTDVYKYEVHLSKRAAMNSGV